MESSLDTHDELRRLQDKVRKLELQNRELRSQQFSRNGFEFEIKQNILSSMSDLEYYKNKLDESNHNWEDEFLKPEELQWENFQNEETWLYKSENDIKPSKGALTWLRQGIENQNSCEMQSIRKELVHKTDEIEQGSRKSFIDTRTFTRPKKRNTRPSLDAMSERSILENRHVLETPWRKLMTKHIPEMIDDISLNCDYTLPSFSSSTFNKEELNLNDTFLKVASETKSIIMPHTQITTTFVKIGEENGEVKSSDSDQSTNSRKASDSSLNVTFTREASSPSSPYHPNRTSNKLLNCSFTHQDTNRTNTASGDSGADDDQLSSASDSSFSSTTRLMNVGDVQTIARLQEESLKQVTSTPKRTMNREGVIIVPGEGNISPIKQTTSESHQGYLSDHSDHSSVDGLARSSRSSVRSSPTGSPFGSTNALPNDCPKLPSSLALRRDARGMPPVAVKSETLKSEVATKLIGGGQRRVMSGMRIPTVRPGTANRPSTVGVSSIPRRASRIPAPRVRSAYTQQTAAKSDGWMDDCY